MSKEKQHAFHHKESVLFFLKITDNYNALRSCCKAAAGLG